MSFLLDMISSKIKKIGFEDVQYAIHHSAQYIIINTLPSNMQDCLIKNTVHSDKEEQVINELLSRYDIKNKPIVVYGMNSVDSGCEKKYKQLMSLGFSDVFMYTGGMFEWLLLQDVYGYDEFPTTKKVIDLLRYKPAKMM